MASSSPRTVDPAHATERRGSCAELFGFLGPGLVHGLGNQVFKIAHSGDLFAESEPARLQSVLSDSCGEAQQQIDLMRVLCGETRRPQASFSLLDALVRAARVALRDLGVSLECSGEQQAPMVRPDAFVWSLARVFECLGEALADRAGVRLHAHLATDERGGASVALRIVFAPGELPFPFDWTVLRQVQDATPRAIGRGVAYEFGCASGATVRFATV